MAASVFKSRRSAVSGIAVVVVIGIFVLYPIFFLLQAALKQGDGTVDGSTGYGLGNFARLPSYGSIVWNTLEVSVVATVIAIIVGFLIAYILTRTNVPFRRGLEQLMAVPYYVTPLLGALAWGLLGEPHSGYINMLWRALGGEGAIINVTSAMGIAWVMALFEGSVAFVMVSAVMQSIDPSLEEASQVIGASRFNTMLRVTLPLVAPGVLGALVYVFAEMLGSFSAALVLGTPSRFYVLTTAIYLMVTQYPPRIPLAAAMGVVLFAVMFLMTYLYRRTIAGRSYVTVSGKAFRPRPIDVGGLRWVYFLLVGAYIFLAVVLPLLTLVYVSLQQLATALPSWSNFTLEHYRVALSQNAVRYAIRNSLELGVLTATIGVALTGMISWLLHRTNLPGRAALEYISMFPQAVPRLVFAFGIMWAWLVLPIPVYGTIWLLLIAYVTVFLPLGVRTISSVLLQLDKTLDECGQVCGANWSQRLRTINIPLLKPGIMAAWMLLFIGSVRELGASILLVGPNSQVLTPAIVDAWNFSSSELTAAMALIQTVVVGVVIAIFTVLMRRRELKG
ncbi:MAG TPA: iron ABC transporter permease [Burkholderiaceae bacterium]|nr:iron ABC transporter permease [Burkholderiaceae bacterium]